jgi:hypothetical protein
MQAARDDKIIDQNGTLIQTDMRLNFCKRQSRTA